MIVYHVCSIAKLEKYQASGKISGPVRAWENEAQAARFSKSTGRPIILRLRFPNDTPKYPGHYNQARELKQDFHMPKELMPAKARKKTQ
jgi:hypothetical protein